MAEEWQGPVLRQRIAEQLKGEVFEVLSSFRISGRLVELLHSPAEGYTLVMYREDGRDYQLGNPDESLETMDDRTAPVTRVAAPAGER